MTREEMAVVQQLHSATIEALALAVRAVCGDEDDDFAEPIRIRAMQLKEVADRAIKELRDRAGENLLADELAGACGCRNYESCATWRRLRDGGM